MVGMKRFWVCGIVLALSATVRAGDREKALEVVNAAIKAHGGEDALTKVQTAIRSGNVSQPVGGKDIALIAEVTLGLPGRFRLDLMTVDKSLRVLSVLNVDRAWRASNGMAVELSKDALQELQEEGYVELLATLVPLKKDVFDLAPIEGKMVNDKPTLGIKVSHKGQADTQLYFDKESGLLVKIERRTRTGGILLDKEYILADFKEFNGVRLPTRRTEFLSGKKAAELSAATYRFPARVDESAFVRP